MYNYGAAEIVWLNNEKVITIDSWQFGSQKSKAEPCDLS